MKTKYKIDEKHVRDWVRAMHRIDPYRTGRALWLAVVSALLLSGVMVLGAINPATHSLEEGFSVPFVVAVTLLLFTALYTYNFWTIRIGLRGAALVAAGLMGSLLISSGVAVLQWLLERALYGNAYETLVITIIIDSSSALIAYLVTLLLYNVTMHQQTLVENEHLQAENMRIRYHTLEQQVSPHFLFNSLNTLDGLIGGDDDGAHRYLHLLSDTFRYTLAGRETVTLAEELAFTRGYADMMQVRYGNEALHCEVHIDPSLLERRLPPISLQLLVENAVKHNVISVRHPLSITIESTPRDTIRVSNVPSPKEGHEESSGIGLANLSGRYRLLMHSDIEITDTENEFAVEIPLIPL